MTKKIEIYFQLENNAKHFQAKESTKISELIENLKIITKDDDINIELFYGGRFLNPNFTVKQIKYNSKFPIIVFTSSDEFKKQYNDLACSRLPTSNEDSEILKKTSLLSTLDADEANFNKLQRYQEGISPSILHDLKDQSLKNNVDLSVMCLLYRKLGNKKEEALNFFNLEKKKFPK